MKKTKYHLIEGTIHLQSGLRIGGSDDLLQIGGTDLTCIKHPVTFKPYIPGSSLKGRLRSELEQRQGRFSGRDENEPCGCATCMICRVFGPHKKSDPRLGPTRIIVRDCQLTKGGELELKTENMIQRKTGVAEHPRKVERVVEGSEFAFRIGIQVWDIDGEACTYTNSRAESSKGADAIIELIKDALSFVGQTGLGSGVSKGSGEIKYVDVKLDGQPLELQGR